MSVVLQDDSEARRKLMLQSFSDQFKSYPAMPDGEFEKYRREAAAFTASEPKFDRQKIARDQKRGMHLKFVKD